MSSIPHRKKTYRVDSIIRYAKMLGCHNLHTKIDLKTGLHAIIAIHNLDLGPAIGGCRFYHAWPSIIKKQYPLDEHPSRLGQTPLHGGD